MKGRKVRTPQGSVLANGEGWRGMSATVDRTPPARKAPQKIYRPAPATQVAGEQGKGEKVRPGFPGLK